MCVCVHLYPSDQAIPAAINAHVSMCKLSYLVHYQLVHIITNLPPRCCFHTNQRPVCFIIAPSHQMTKVRCREPTVKGFHTLMRLNVRSRYILFKLTYV